jgi:hypothetical protein
VANRRNALLKSLLANTLWHKLPVTPRFEVMAMLSRRLAVLALLLLLPFVAAMPFGCTDKSTATSLPAAAFTTDSYDGIKDGMTLAEVENHIGGPGTPGTDKLFLLARRDVKVPANAEWKKWQVHLPGKTCFIGVAFVDGKVVGKFQHGL